MEKIDWVLRNALGRRLECESQAQVMDDLPQFSQAKCIAGRAAAPPADRLCAAVFNMERGAQLYESIDFLKDCPALQPADLIFANELDDGCARSGLRDNTRLLAEVLGMYAVFGLEFIELNTGPDEKGYHGNALLSRWPITWAEVLRLPEAYNWYFDRQKRIGGRCAVFARLDVGGRALGAVSVHLENRTDGIGRRRQMQAVLDEAARVFTGLPVIIGGDLNTNTFDGRDRDIIGKMADDPVFYRAHLDGMAVYEPLFEAAAAAGYRWQDAGPMTRRKPLPGGRTLELQLDWILQRGLRLEESRVVSTRRADCTFARAGSALADFQGQELSDHNVVWARLVF